MAVSDTTAMCQLSIDVYKCVQSVMKEILKDGHRSDLLTYPFVEE